MAIKEIILNDGNVILLSDIDYPFIKSLYEMYVDKHGYVQCKSKYKKQLELETGSLHRVIMQPPNEGRKIVVDHINGNKLDNRRENLRIVTHHQNMLNRKANKVYNGKETTSKYKGVYYSVREDAWATAINIDKKRVKLGIFETEIAASNCYNYHARIHHKEFANYSDVPFMEKEEWMKYKKGMNYTSKYKGVSYDKSSGKWLAQICHNYNREVVGRFNTELDAVIAYNKRAIELLGDKAKLNKIN